MAPAMATVVLIAISLPLGAEGDALPPRLDGLPCSVGCEDCAGNGKGQCSQSECRADAWEAGDFHCALPWNGSSTPVRCCLPKECTSDEECEEGKICGARYICREPSCAAIGGTCRAPDMAEAGPGGNTPPACLPHELAKYYDRTTCYSECGYFWGQCGQTCCLPGNSTGAVEGMESGELPTLFLAPSLPMLTLPAMPGLLVLPVPAEGASSVTAVSSSDRPKSQPEQPQKVVQGSTPQPVTPGPLLSNVPEDFASGVASASVGWPAVSKAALREPELGGILGEKGASPTAWVSSEVAFLALVAVLALVLLRRVDTNRVETLVEEADEGLLQQARE